MSSPSSSWKQQEFRPFKIILMVICTVIFSFRTSLVSIRNIAIAEGYERQEEEVIDGQDANANDEVVLLSSTNQIDHFVYRITTSTNNNNNNNTSNSNSNRVLPNNKLFMVGPYVNHDIIEHNAKFLWDGMEIHVFNHSSMERSVELIDQQLRKQEGGGVIGAWETYQMLRPWAYRADLWRYMILWSEGGTYIDSKIRLQTELESWATLSNKETFATCYDHIDAWTNITTLITTTASNITTNNDNNDNPNHRIYWNAVLSAKKGSPILLDIIRRMIDNVKNRVYPGKEHGIKKEWMGSLAISGPLLLGLVVDDAINKAEEEKDSKDNTSNTLTLGPEAEAAGADSTTTTTMTAESTTGTVRIDCKYNAGKQGVYQLPSSSLPQQKGTTGGDGGGLLLIMTRDDAEHKKVQSIGGSYYDLFKNRLVYCDDDGDDETNNNNNSNNNATLSTTTGVAAARATRTRRTRYAPKSDPCNITNI